MSGQGAGSVGREQGLWAGTASHQSPLGSAEQEGKGEHSVHGTSLWLLLSPEESTRAPWGSLALCVLPVWGLQWGACSLFVCPDVGAGLSPAQVRRGSWALSEQASFINPSAEKGGRNCHNNSDDRLI